jgi:nicotinamidase-related amidase
MSIDTALVVIDVQVGLIDEAYRCNEVLDNINLLLSKARATGTPVIYIQHDGPQGDGLEVGTSAWEIHSAIAPQEGELIVHKRASDSFHATSLLRENVTLVGDAHTTDNYVITVKPTNEVTF